MLGLNSVLVARRKKNLLEKAGPEASAVDPGSYLWNDNATCTDKRKKESERGVLKRRDCGERGKRPRGCAGTNC